MKRTLGRFVGVVGGMVAMVGVWGSGSAGAVDEYKGLTYEKAVGYISQWGTPVIATRIGEYLPTDQCIVTGSRDSSTQGGTVLLDLNCNDTSAYNGHAGNSVATPTGRQIKSMRDKGRQYSESYAEAVDAGQEFWCGAQEDYLEWCRKVCSEGGTCSAELLQYLG